MRPIRALLYLMTVGMLFESGPMANPNSDYWDTNSDDTPPDKPQEFNGNYDHATGGTTPHADPVTHPPVVPGKPDTAGAGQVKVDTASLKYFADAMDQLNTAVNTAYTKLNGIKPVAPGAFKQATEISTKVNGDGDTGLKAGYLKVLNDLNNGLLGVRDGMRQLANKFQSVEDANGITAEKFTEVMQDTDGKFSQANTDGAVT